MNEFLIGVNEERREHVVEFEGVKRHYQRAIKSLTKPMKLPLPCVLCE
jgi:hypothetical protein